MKVAIVTGGTVGLGLSLVKDMIGLGYKVYASSRSDAHWEGEIKPLLESGKVHVSKVDASLESNVKDWIEFVLRRENRIDILINNAGAVHDLSRVEETSTEDFELNINTNLYGVYYSCKYAIPQMLNHEEERMIINISSMAGVRGVPTLGAYSASKMAVLGLSQSIAKENYENNLRCIIISPGGINTSMRAKAFGEEDAVKQQSAGDVSGIVKDIVEGKIRIPSGSNICIRHGEVTEIYKSPDH